MTRWARAVLPTALAQRNLVRSLLGDCPSDLRPQLLSVYSEMSTSIAYYFFDHNDYDSARHYGEQARAAAQDAGNVELTIFALCEMSDHASWQGKAHPAIELAAAAQTRSARLVKELRTTRARMQPWQTTPAVTQLDDQLAAYGLVPSSPAP